MTINGESKVVGFLGSTYKASKMFALYNAAFKALELNYIYVPFVVNDLKQAVQGIRHLGIHGVGVTIPYKIKVLQYLDTLDQNAKRIGAVNAIINKDGKLMGANTDGIGGVRALKEQTKVKGKSVAMLGAGGAARALAFALIDEGAIVTIINRTEQTAVALAKATNSTSIRFEKRDEAIKTAEIIINTTSVGMAPEIDNSLVDRSLLHKNMVVFDLVHYPKETKLLKDAKTIGCKLVYGDRMLLWQAVEKFELFTGYKAPIEVMEEALCYAF